MAFFYSLDDDAGGAFAIDPNTGTLTVRGAVTAAQGSTLTPILRAKDLVSGLVTVQPLPIVVQGVYVPPLALSGAIPGTGGVSGSLSVLNVTVLAGAVPGAGALTGALSNASPRALAGSVPGAGSLSGALTVAAAGTNPLAGSIPGSGALTGALAVTAASGLVQARKGRVAAAMAA